MAKRESAEKAIKDTRRKTRLLHLATSGSYRDLIDGDEPQVVQVRTQINF